MVEERAWFKPMTSGCPALSSSERSASYGAKTPPKSKSPEASEEPIRTSTVAIGRPAGPWLLDACASALLSVVSSESSNETTNKSSMLASVRLRMSWPLTAIAMNGLAMEPEGEATAKEKASTPCVGTAISREAVLAGATARETHRSSVTSEFCKPNAPFPIRSMDHSLAPSNPISSRKPSGNEVRTNSTSTESQVKVPLPEVLTIRS